MSDKYRIRLLPMFADDLNNAVDYISKRLKNPEAAHRLVDNVEAAINKRAYNPKAFEEYHSLKERAFPYYRIYVGNYMVFYVVIEDVMEVRRLIYKRSNLAGKL